MRRAPLCQILRSPVKSQSRDQVGVLVSDQDIVDPVSFKYVEVSGRDPAAEAAAAEAKLPVMAAAEGGNALIPQSARHKEVFPVRRKADRAADTSVVGGRRDHQFPVGRSDFAAVGTRGDGRDGLRQNIVTAGFVEAVCKDCVGHFRDHEQHSGVAVVEGEMSGTGSVRKTDAAVCVQKLPAGPVEFIDVDHVESQVADEHFIPLTVKRREMSMRTLLAVGRIISDAAVLTKITECAYASVAAERKQSGTSAPVVGAEKVFAARVQTDVAGTLAGARKAVHNGQSAAAVRFGTEAGIGTGACSDRTISPGFLPERIYGPSLRSLAQGV